MKGEARRFALEDEMIESKVLRGETEEVNRSLKESTSKDAILEQESTHWSSPILSRKMVVMVICFLIFRWKSLEFLSIYVR